MKLTRSLLLGLAAAAVASVAIAGNTTLFSSRQGDIVFPISPPTGAGDAGAIDNMIIGATTPRAATFTTITGSASLTGPIVAPSITGNDSSLGVAGQAAAQGGAIAVVGGASSTSANAGGAVTLTGGTPGATGVGGGVTITSGAGGSTSGAGGAIAITGGAATSANGSTVTITAGAGAGGTNAGGSVNLVPGAAVSTGIPGTVKVNGDDGLICANFAPHGAPAAATDTAFFIATRPLLVVQVSEVHAVAAGGASVLQVTKDTSTNAPGAGTDLLTNNTNTGFDLNATANTVQVGTLVATVATKTLAAGDRLSVDFAQAIQSSSGITVTACMAPL